MQPELGNITREKLKELQVACYYFSSRIIPSETTPKGEADYHERLHRYIYLSILGTITEELVHLAESECEDEEE